MQRTVWRRIRNAAAVEGRAVPEVRVSVRGQGHSV